MIEITENSLREIYDRNEILCENGEVDFRKATHRIIVQPSGIGDIHVNQIRDLSDSDISWITIPGIYPSSIEAAEAYEKFKENFEFDGGLVVEKGRIYQLIDGVVRPKDEEDS